MNNTNAVEVSIQAVSPELIFEESTDTGAVGAASAAAGAAAPEAAAAADASEAAAGAAIGIEAIAAAGADAAAADAPDASSARAALKPAPNNDPAISTVSKSLRIICVPLSPVKIPLLSFAFV